jgi:hypothetical protein
MSDHQQSQTPPSQLRVTFRPSDNPHLRPCCPSHAASLGSFWEGGCRSSPYLRGWPRMWSGPPDGKGEGEALPQRQRDAIVPEPADPPAPPPAVENTVQAPLGPAASESIPNLALESPPAAPLGSYPLAAQGLQSAANNALMQATLTDSLLAAITRNISNSPLTTTENLVAMMGLLSPAVGASAWPSVVRTARRLRRTSLNTAPRPAGNTYCLLL